MGVKAQVGGREGGGNQKQADGNQERVRKNTRPVQVVTISSSVGSFDNWLSTRTKDTQPPSILNTHTLAYRASKVALNMGKTLC